MSVTRRQFLKTVVIVPAAAAAFPMPLLRGMMGVPGSTRNLVLLDLKGGNDGLNTVVPFGVDGGLYYSEYRKSLAIPQNQLLQISPQIGLNPTMTHLKAHFDAGRLAIVQGVGYPNPSFSHEVAETIWQTGVTSGSSATGWLARYLEQVGAQASPNAVSLNEQLTLLLADSGTFVPAFESLDDFTFPYDGWHSDDAQNRRDCYESIANALGAAPNEKIATMSGTSTGILDLIDTFATIPSFSHVGVYPQGGVSGRFKLVAKLLNANIGMRYFHVPFGGFDTHADQEVDDYHSERMGNISQTISAFYDDLVAMGIADDTIVVVFSEFGRTVYQNGSGGTDHGYVNPVLVFGSSVAGGLIGAHPSLDPQDATDEGEPPMVTDFRNVFGTLVSQWLGGDAAAAIPGWSLTPVPFLA